MMKDDTDILGKFFETKPRRQLKSIVRALPGILSDITGDYRQQTCTERKTVTYTVLIKHHIQQDIHQMAVDPIYLFYSGSSDSIMKPDFLSLFTNN